MESPFLLASVHDMVIVPTPMDSDFNVPPAERPIPDSREYDTLLSRVLVAERHSSLFESEVKRLGLENQRLNSKLENDKIYIDVLQSESMRLNLENDRLESKFEDVAYLQFHCVDYINAQLAQRDDALQRQRIRDDGIFCGCCALLRLPDHFFPAMLSARVPPSRRRCAFCVRAVRANFECFGRDFFVPPGFIMPRLHPDDSKRLTDLHRCYSCASMRHISMTSRIYDADVPIDLALLDSQTRLLAPLPRDTPRANTASQKFSVCVFCRRDLQRNRIAPPKPPRRQSDEPVPDWEPDPDYPGDCDSPDDSDYFDDIDQEVHW